ncbi:MAG: agmatine deiminase family protein [Clostridiales bacterium]|nr:agmatine deiminase family protein [Clostridiales bacterium]
MNVKHRYKHSFRMPAEWEPHEGTWLQWPHEESPWGKGYRAKIEHIWVAMVKELHIGEKVHIIVYSDTEKQRVLDCLSGCPIDYGQVDFFIQETDDVWVRDNGPIFVKGDQGKIVALDWNFNGWGNKYRHGKDRLIAKFIADAIGAPLVKAPICLEGGGVEFDGHGTLMASKTSIINENRNPGMNQAEIESALSEYFGVTNFVWIAGLRGEDNNNEDTDWHIDGAARFAGAETIMYKYNAAGNDEEFYLAALEKHYQELRNATNINGGKYKLIPVPVTKGTILGSAEGGTRTGKGSYLNYLVGNEVVLVPVYGDENDALGLRIVEGQFPGRRVVGINVRALYPYGGMIHCVTQQQPL